MPNAKHELHMDHEATRLPCGLQDLGLTLCQGVDRGFFIWGSCFTGLKRLVFEARMVP